MSPTAEEATSAGNVIGGAGDELFQPDGQAPLLTPAAEFAASVGSVIGGAGDRHGWCGPTSFKEMCKLGTEIALNWAFLGSRPCDFRVASYFYLSCFEAHHHGHYGGELLGSSYRSCSMPRQACAPPNPG